MEVAKEEKAKKEEEARKAAEEPANEHPYNYLVFDITANNTFAYRQSVGTFTCE